MASSRLDPGLNIHSVRPSTPAMDSDHTSDSESEDAIMPVPASLPASGGGITFISPFETFNNSTAGNVRILPTQIASQATPRTFQNPAFHTTNTNSSTQLASPHAPRRGSHINLSVRDELEQGDRRRNSVDAAVLQEFAPSNGTYQRRPSKRMKQEQSFLPVSSQHDIGPKWPKASSSAMRTPASDPAACPETLFADHLTAILRHALSLCSGQGETMLDLFLRGDPQGIGSPNLDGYDDSPRSSISATSPPNTATSAHFPQRVNRVPSIPNMLSPLRRMQLIEQMQEWSFDALSLEADELWECASIMFECVMQMEGVDTGISLDQMRSLLLALRSAYHARNGYHNFAHATDVLQATYTFLVALEIAPPLSSIYSSRVTLSQERWQRPEHVMRSCAIGQILRPMDVFALMIAAIGHDVGHPGLSNAYMVNARTPVAQVYGDKSVLENFHTVTLIQMLRKHGLGHLFGPSTRAPSAHDPECRKVLFASILATDMGRHFPFVSKLQDLGRQSSGTIARPDNVEEVRLLLCSGLMKCADISNPSRPHAVAKHWSTALLEEWTVQAKIEEEFKLPVSVVILNSSEAKAQAKSQVGFINLFTQPLFDAIGGCLPELQTFSTRCREGRRIWEAIIVQPDEAFVPAPASPSTRIVSPNATPRAVFSERMWSANDAVGDSLSPRTYRRRPPPQPLSFTSDSGGSADSIATSATSPSLLSPCFNGSVRFPSFSSSVSSTGSFGSPLVQTSCTGKCGDFTAQCVPCLKRERGDVEAPRSESLTLGNADKRLLQMPGMTCGTPIIVEDDAFGNDIWPPHPFYPTALA